MSELDFFDFNENNPFLAWLHWQEFLKLQADLKEKQRRKEEEGEERGEEAMEEQ